MTVKDVVCDALCLLGKEDIKDAIIQSLESGTEMSAEVERYAKLFTLIADSVTKELYSCYFPDVTTYEIYATKGIFDLSLLIYPMIGLRKVINISAKKEITEYTLEGGKIITPIGVYGIAVVYDYTSYDYTSLTNKLADIKPYITPDVVVTGMVAEYYCTIGDTVNAALWQERYENKVKLILDSGLYRPYPKTQKTGVKNVCLPDRRWV